ITILLAGPPDQPRVLDRRTIHLSDPGMPESIQPYHAAKFPFLMASTRVADRLSRVVRQATKESVKELLTDYREAAHQVRRAGLVVGREIDPAKIGNDHIRAHALEGRLFRSALLESLEASGVKCSVFVERILYSNAATVLKRSKSHLSRTITDLGKAV